MPPSRHCVEAASRRKRDFAGSDCGGEQALVARGDAFLLEVDGRAMPRCTHGARASDMVQIGGVWRPPELRGRGHARAVIAGALPAARAAGARRAVLFVGEGNLPAKQAYRALASERVGNYGVVRFAG